ncbi:GntR family transcriptional regulator [Leifsonia sp. AG29]|uniref:GntR family transcriptional regulator n=1 Tax=Leifsonia sp. AG29 TaxID=2598860 RepID=UPI0018EED46F|nr:GntR family transcriptional regulator [Leifsonia sp. AG29]
MIIDDLPALSPANPLLAAERRLLRNDVYEVLLQHIITGELAPGTRLKDADLTEWLRVSRTPVREALSRLSSVGLVKTSPNRFTLVAPLDEREVADAVAVLRRLYPAALRDFADVADPDAELELALLAGRLEREDGLSPVAHLQRLMVVVLGSQRNTVLAEAIETVHLRVMRYLNIVPDVRAVLDRGRLFDLTQALCARDPEAPRLLIALLDDLSAALDARAS